MTVGAEFKLGANARLPLVASRRQINRVTGVVRGQINRGSSHGSRMNPLKLVVACAEAKIPTGVVGQRGGAKGKNRRSEERRVGKEWRSRRAPYHEKKKKEKNR